MNPTLSILMVNYNTREMTLECLRSVLQQTTATTFEIILVDNNSHDGSSAAIRAEFPDVKLISLGENRGFARGTNLAAQNAGGEYLLLLNTDTVVLDGALDNLVAFAKNDPRAGIWGGRTLFGDRSLNPTSCWRRLTLWGLFCQAAGLSNVFRNSEIFNSDGYGGWKRDSVRHVDIVTGCLLLIRRELWLQLGGFAEEFFMYGEEADLCLRARAFGAQPVITPSATIIHYGGGSATVKSDKMLTLLRAKVELVKRHWPRRLHRPGWLLLEALVASRLLLAKLLHAVRASKENLENRRSWQTTWDQRALWLQGYPATKAGERGGQARG